MVAYYREVKEVEKVVEDVNVPKVADEEEKVAEKVADEEQKEPEVEKTETETTTEKTDEELPKAAVENGNGEAEPSAETPAPEACK